ncbi:type I restriction-modification system endonuclease [Candidatus Enterococcus mansonii]|uniref:Uncharacterized protein n=1 Tax=Candidatus Enterococcus mansonii TaxID=1834181 RepID=A0A242CIM5_9ENTE|nr:type I restriction-modification system endonuclease [Enterococcus sp. 4G2_DIV0659]OTO10085.1 hypothetical protein A5880_000768 [Enterococcus sp. 4G2_DIV0659]
MESNFSFFSKKWVYLANLGEAAQRNAFQDPNASLIKTRQYSEAMVEAIFRLENMNIPKGFNQCDKINYLSNKGVLSKSITEIFHRIRMIGNKAAHNGNYGITDEAKESVKFIFYLGCWFMKVYDIHTFKAPEFQTLVDEDSIRESKIATLENHLLKQQKEFEKILDLLKGISQTSETKKERREASKKFTSQYPLDEKDTRVLIDQQLRDAGWECDTKELNFKINKTMPKKNRKMAIAEWRCGDKWADYALFNGTKLIGIVEAKKYEKDIPGDIGQAKEYAKNVQSIEGTGLFYSDRDYKVPFIYATNGRPYLKQIEEKSGIYFWDSRTPQKAERALEAWHSPKDLEQKLKSDEQVADQELQNEPYPEFAERNYQIEAIKAVEAGLKDNKERMLLAMATGTGKTRTALALMYRLIKTDRVRRVLFLVDRTALGTQAADALKDTKIEKLAFSDIYDVKEVTEAMPEDTTRIQIATVQGMVHRLFYSGNEEARPSVGQYDFIIVDEAHRGYTEDREMSDEALLYMNQNDYVSQYRRVIDFFDATVLGLTATPALHTTEIFGEPIYTYSYTDAVVDGYLVDHEPPYKFETELSKNGISFVKDEEIDVWNNESQSIDKTKLKDNLSFEVDKFNRKVMTEEFNRVILDRLTEDIYPNDEEKTLIFAANDQHADKIVKLLKEIYSDKGVIVEEHAIEKITGAIYDSGQMIKRFKNEKYPSIAVTVDLLTTGIDVPEICNLVFLRRVRSRILYDQMLGRATRLCKRIGKESFKIYDAVHLYDGLQKISDMKPVVKNPNHSITYLLDESLQSKSEEEFNFYKKELIAKLQRKKQSLTEKQEEELKELNNVDSIDKWLQNLKEMSKVELQSQVKQIERMAYSKNVRYSMYISNHKDTFIDETRGYGEGNERPGDYLDSFNRFIRENMNLIPALQIVVKRPKELTIVDLRSIRLTLKEKHFDEKDLQSAWKKEKKETIAADIISFIRQAALGSPLVPHEQRIKNAMEKVYQISDWTNIQESWLNRIEKQLLQTTVLAPTAKEFFEENQLFEDSGGYNRMKQIFKDDVDTIVEVINDNLYA